MKKLLFATAFASTALASSMGCNTDTLTGLHFGLGVSVLFDKYEADVDVGTSVPYAKKVTNIDLGTINNDYIAADVKTLVKDIWNGTPALVALGKNGPNISKKEAGDTTTGTGDPIIEYKSATNLTFDTVYSADRALFMKNHTFKKRTTNCGGEIKLAYFHDFGNHLMIGVDLTGVIASKNKKTVHVEPGKILYPDELRVGGVTGITTTDGTGTSEDTATDVADSISVGTDFSEMLPLYNKEGGVLLNCTDYDTGTDANADAVFNEMALVTAKYKVGEKGVYTEVSDPGQLTFEKSVFNPRLAFIVGGTVYGWFAGLRLGMSYTTGKVYATGGKLTGQGTQSKTVSISSPLIGLHLMKQLKIAGNNDAHLYLTADWNIGDGRRSVYINGVRNFRQTGYNISAGITWRFKLGN